MLTNISREKKKMKSRELKFSSFYKIGYCPMHSKHNEVDEEVRTSLSSQFVRKIFLSYRKIESIWELIRWLW